MVYIQGLGFYQNAVRYWTTVHVYVVVLSKVQPSFTLETCSIQFTPFQRKNRRYLQSIQGLRERLLHLL